MQVEKRIQNFEKMGMGLFVHWGLYSYFSKGEWSQNILNIPNYNDAFNEFNPDIANIKGLVKMAKDKGFKYIVLTTKHHDGFCLFNSKGNTRFDSMHTPFAKDVIKIFVDECHKQGISPFFYYATYDWKNPKYESEFKEYLKELRSTIDLLSTNYGKIGGFWFDGTWDKPSVNWENDKLYKLIRKNQPNAMIINNTGLEKQGVSEEEDVDVLTFERGKPKEINHFQHGRYFAGETSLTLNKHWGNAQNDINYISSRHLIEQICNSRRVGANILINVGLEFDGSLNIQSRALIDSVGKWMEFYGKAIYNISNFNSKTFNSTNESAFIKGNYLFIKNLGNIGNSNVVLGGEKNQKIRFNDYDKKIISIKWMDNSQDISFEQNLENKTLEIYANGFEYGTHLVERVAEIRTV